MNKIVKLPLLILSLNISAFVFADTNMAKSKVETKSQSTEYIGQKRFYDACVKLNNEKVDLLIIKMKRAYKRTIKSVGSTVEARCKFITKDINAWGVELNASEYRMNGFYDFLVKQMKKQL